MHASISLRPAAEAELELIHRLVNDPLEAGEYGWFGWQAPTSLRRRWHDDGLLGDDGGMLVVERDTQPVGFVSWRSRQTARTSFCWNIGIALRPAARGRGCGTRAQSLLVRYLFSHTWANRVEAVTEHANVAEQRALEKAGFTREGVLRGLGFRQGRWRDGVVYSVLRHEVDLAADEGEIVKHE